MEKIKMMLFFLIMEVFSYEWDSQKQNRPDPEKKFVDFMTSAQLWRDKKVTYTYLKYLPQ